MSRRAERATAAAGVALALLAVGGLAGRRAIAEQKLYERVEVLTHGDPDAGRTAIHEHACGGCHQIPGIPGAAGRVGPPLAGIAGRAIIAGRLSNTPEHMIAWIQDPKAVDAQTAMPRMGLTTREARDIAAYLYTLQ